MPHLLISIRIAALAFAAGQCAALAQPPQPTVRWTAPVQAPSTAARPTPRSLPPARPAPPPSVVDQAFLDSYQALQRPRIAVISTGWREAGFASPPFAPSPPPPDSAPDSSPADPAVSHRQDPANIATALATSVGQLLSAPKVLRVPCAGGPMLAQDASLDPAAAAAAACTRCDADITIMLTVADQGDAYAGSYVMVDGRRDANLGSWSFSITPNEYGVLDRSRLNEYSRKLAEHISAQFAAAAAFADHFTMRFSGIQPADLPNLQRVLRQVPGVRRVGEFREDADEWGTTGRVDIEYAGPVTELAALVVAGAQSERIHLRAERVRLGELNFATDAHRLSEEAAFLCGDDDPPAQALHSIEAMRKAYEAAGSPPISLSLESDAGGELGAALSRRLRAIGLIVLDRGEPRPGDLELRAQPAPGGAHSFRIAFIAGDELAACPAERAIAATPDRRARAAIGTLAVDLRRSLEAPASVNVTLLGAHAIEDVTPVTTALRQIPGVTAVHLRRLSAGSGQDAAELWLGYRGNLETLVTQLKTRRDSMPFSFDDGLVRSGVLEVTIKDK